MTFVSFAQNYEDLILWRALNAVENGFYIDVGAADPVEMSVTCAFYERGWTGINIEPTQGNFAKLAAARPRDINLNVAVGSASGVVKFHELASAGLSTVDAEIAQRHIATGLDHTERFVPMLPLAGICQQRGDLPIHFLKVDVEGAERDVLLSMDFGRHRPWIVLVEATEPLTQNVNKQEWEHILLENGYSFSYFDGLNCFYVAEEKKELSPLLALPPNIFDDVIKKDDQLFRQQAEAWRVELLQLGETAEQWRRQVVETQSYVDALKQQHQTQVGKLDAKLRAMQADFEAQRTEAAGRHPEVRAARNHESVLRDQQDQARDERIREEHAQLRLEHEESRLQQEARLSDTTAALAATHASASWRVTAPLRGLVQRNPVVVRQARRLTTRFPGAGRNSLWLARNAWRLATLRPLVRRPSVRALLPVPPPLPEIAAPQAAAPAPTEPLLWFHVGDTLEWLGTHPHLTGVGRVTTKILAAALADTDGPRWHLSVLGDGALAEVPLAEATGNPTAMSLRAVMAQAPRAGRDPAPGDHVVFTGLVWTPTYVELFERLSANGIHFSVMLFDLIPIERVDLVGAAHRDGFARFLSVITRKADVIFTSAAVVRAQLARWMVADGVVPRHPVQVINFGYSLDHSRSLAEPTTVQGPFVLCVGTIDRRKNQLLLCRAWAKLASARQEMPQLVLVGRDDLKLSMADPEISALIGSGAIRILTDVPDAELDALYRAAMFTVFPSFSEGYGLPVADSLAYGQLCLAADLPVIREWAGDLPWYFPPHDVEALRALLEQALDDPQAVRESRDRAAAWEPRPWLETARAIGNEASMFLGARHASASPAQPIPPVQANALAALAQAERWCVANRPEVSIVVVNWNAAEMTQACIRHLWANTTDVTYEIIVADNGSSPLELAALGRLGDGVRLLPLNVNRFFGEANNIAVEAAQGRYVCLLNNDVFVGAGWLSRLLHALRENPSAGAVGPVFLFPDGTIQEAGGIMDERGFPVRSARGEPASARAALRDGAADYISAACLLMRRDLFLRVGGFDLAYEPAYYEDVDLCFKIAALGQEVRLVASVDVVHLEGYSTRDETIPAARKKALGDLNRGKFVSRWHGFLQAHDPHALRAIGASLLPAPARPGAPMPDRRILVYSPYPLTPGGGERYLLTIAAILLEGSAVTIATPHPYSQLRLLQLGREFGIDLAGCRTVTLAQAEGDAAGDWDMTVVLGNHVVPPIAARGRRNFFICQFPFPMLPDMPVDPAMLAGYEGVLCYSRYVERNIEAATASAGLPVRPIHVLEPPVPQFPADGRPKKNVILTVGRFFTGGHSKRHDVLIEAFRALQARYEEPVEFHLAGSSIPDSGQMDYLGRLQAMSAGLPITFHVNATPEALEQLYREAVVYWHGTGLHGDLQKFPEIAEHFGIAIVEAMSAGCVAFALDAGGAPEIITDGVDGYLYDSVDTLVERTLAVLRDGERRDAVGRQAVARAAAFAPPEFARGVAEFFA